MAERRNGMMPQNRRMRGGDRRGMTAVPRAPWSDSLQRSLLDKKRLQELAREKFLPKESSLDYGNKDLPAYRHKQEIIDLVDRYKAVILGGPTGSGKSTQVPQYLLEAGYDKVYMMVPRRIIADGLHDRLVEELSAHLGDEARDTVGVVHGERAEFSDDNRIIVMTPNTFVRMEAEIRKQYGDKKIAFISDEIHEANLYTEIATGVAAQAVDEHEGWRIIAASATHNSASLEQSFSQLNDGYVPTINIEGRPFNVDVQEAPEDSSTQAYARLGLNHVKSMIFTSGKREIDHIIDETRRILEANETGSSQKVMFRKLHGELTDIELNHINDPIPEGYRLVIVSSPAGMSGITIPGVTLVVSDGTINRSELDEEGASGLTRSYLSRAEVTQQMGRAGRDVPGGIGVLTAPTAVEEDKIRAKGNEVEVEQMPFMSLSERHAFGPPEIYHSNLSQVVLSVASLDRNFSDINRYIPHAVAGSAIIKAEETLARLGALDDEDRVTQIGRVMSRFPVRPELSRGIAESLERHRSLQHLARLALIAAGVEAGGVQDYSNKQNQEWKKLLRPTTRDDMMAQFDLLAAEFPDSPEGFVGFTMMYDLHYRRVKQAQKVARKILKSLGIRTENVVLTPPTLDEEADLREDLLAGMIDYVYEKTDGPTKRQYYKNIHGDEGATRRYISDRSIVSRDQHEYVTGFPRWFETSTRTGERKKHDVIEQLMPVDPDLVGQYAQKNGILTHRRTEAQYRAGEVVEMYQPLFGSIAVGAPEVQTGHEEIPVQSQNLLVHHVLQSPGPAQKALREIADELDRYEKRIPENELKTYFKDDAPELITKRTIESMIRSFAKQTRRAHEVDQGLATIIFRENLGIGSFFDDDVREELIRRSPSGLMVNGSYLQLHYQNRQPYVTSKARLPRGEVVTLPDGREVMVKLTKQGKSTLYKNVDISYVE